MEFLRARWQDLLLVTYQVPDDWLRPHLASGLELDRFEGSACVSLVAFDFLDTRVLGVPWPGFVNFPELNLRFYVRAGRRRGVSFVREYVPSRLVAWIARTLYGEAYLAAPMSSVHGPDGHHQHTLVLPGRPQLIRWQSDESPVFPPEGSTEDFFKEHEWGFVRGPGGALRCYRVDHPRWRIHPLREWQLEVDFAALYGSPWGALQNQDPVSVVHAEGSAVKVYPYAVRRRRPSVAGQPPPARR